MTRKQYRASWVRNDYAQRRANGQCTRCPAKANGWLCDECADFDRAYRRRKRKRAA